MGGGGAGLATATPLAAERCGSVRAGSSDGTGLPTHRHQPPLRPPSASVCWAIVGQTWGARQLLLGLFHHQAHACSRHRGLRAGILAAGVCAHVRVGHLQGGAAGQLQLLPARQGKALRWAGLAGAGTAWSHAARPGTGRHRSWQLLFELHAGCCSAHPRYTIHSAWACTLWHTAAAHSSWRLV